VVNPRCEVPQFLHRTIHVRLPFEPDPTKFAVGGCNIIFGAPTIVCRECGWEGLIIEARGDEDQAIGGLLHDVAEDCGGEIRLREIKKKFGVRVVTIVRGCSESLGAKEEDKAPWRDRKAEHIERLYGANNDILLITAADKTHNARAIVTNLDLIGSSLWERFNATPQDILWYYESVYDVLKMRGVTSILLSPLSAAIASMKRHV
jgi:hypothetical protein